MPNQPQAAFAGFACSLQFEWAYLQRAMKISSNTFDPTKSTINEKLLPALFGVPVILANLCTLTSLP
eukprot:7972437-Ditylum_brightwellii.AAC.1